MSSSSPRKLRRLKSDPLQGLPPGQPVQSDYEVHELRQVPWFKMMLEQYVKQNQSWLLGEMGRAPVQFQF
jgi:hypothetical protein